MFDGSNGPHGGNVKFQEVGISMKLGWCKFGKELVDLLFLNFLWIASALKVVFDFIVPHLLLVTVTVWNLTELVIVIAVDDFTFAFKIVEAFADGSSNLVLGSAIVIRMKRINGIWINGIVFAFLGEGWWNQQVAFIKGPPEFVDHKFWFERKFDLDHPSLLLGFNQCSRDL